MFANSFDTEERSFKNRKISTAAFVTIAVHALILLFLIWSILTPPDPPYTDSAGGVTVNFGNVDEGSGDEQPMTLTPIQADFTPAAPSASQSQPAPAEEDIATQELEDAPVIEKTVTDKPKPKTEKPVVKPTVTTKPTTSSTPAKTETPAPPAPKPDDNAMFKKGGAKGNPNNSTGDGTGTKSGDQGKPNGDDKSKSYLDGEGGNGSGPGKGDLRGGVSLKGRKSTSLPPPRFCNAKGNVIIDITVDKNGIVVDAKYHRDGSTITDRCSIDNAIIAAKRSKFNPDNNADDMQYGSINYVFTVQ
ncbi:MAG: cell envelope integrity protein TolA [Chitinophagales bacterium]|nr:cell envelope integrity protein TolA [Chitinophagales bacterium]